MSELVVDSAPAAPTHRAVPIFVAALAAAAALALAVVGARDQSDALAIAAAVVAGVWAATAVFCAWVRPTEPLWGWCAIGALAIGLAIGNRELLGALPVVGFAIAVTLPTGAPRTRVAQVFFAVGLVVGAVFAGVVASSAEDRIDVVVVQSAVLGVLALVAVIVRIRGANALDRARLLWALWGVGLAAVVAGSVWVMHRLVEWPAAIGPTILGASAVVPVALAFAAVDRFVLQVERVLVATIEAVGLVLFVGTVYLVVVLGFGEAPDESGRQVLGLSVVAAAIATLLFVPVRNRLAEGAGRWVYGERRAPDEPLQTFGARMSRAIPLDELLLQLAESLKRSMRLSSAEVWTGTDGVLERAASVPFRDATRFRLEGDELSVVSRAHVSGNAWIQVWLPALLEEHPNQLLRVAPMAHSGELLGLVVCAREADDQPFSEDEERVLTELARQVTLALHNSALDTALQASLDDLRIANEELRASRSRIVAAADQSRRQIERNLHDGAQQHLVALAVKLGLARQLLDADPASVATILEELRTDAQTTLTELRELAHGIYPPLLMDRGLPEALRAAANRSVLPTDVTADVGRFPPELEAAVYFCCLEAIQNAGKHAGEGARITITVEADAAEMRFEVADDGAGFVPQGKAITGHGFVNMADRVGSIGGTLEVESAPGSGTRVKGRIPLVVAIP